VCHAVTIDGFRGVLELSNSCCRSFISAFIPVITDLCCKVVHRNKHICTEKKLDSHFVIHHVENMYSS
jgi:hypothetical protein